MDFPNALVDWYVELLQLDRSSLRIDVDAGPFSIHLGGRGVFFLVVTVVILTIAGIAVALSGKQELRQKWLTWVLILPVVGIPIWLGKGTTTALAIVLAVIASAEYARMIVLPRPDRVILLACAVVYPLLAWLRPGYLALVPLVVLLCALPSIFEGDLTDGVRRTAFTGFGTVWIAWSLAHLVILWENAFLVCFAAAATDVAAWCGGKGFKRFAWGARPLSPLSPNKTVGGLVGAVLGAVLVLTLLGTISVGLVIAVAFGGVLGDLLESMFKRQAGVKDAGDWLPGFGGLLDRIDSLLLVLPLAAVLA